jgi:hypothetical protein
VGQEARLSARVCQAAFPARSAETRGGPPTCGNPRKYLSQAIFQYRISGDAIATSCWAKASRLPPNEIGLPLGSGMLVDLAVIMELTSRIGAPIFFFREIGHAAADRANPSLLPR